MYMNDRSASGRKKIAVVGAGIAGLTAAYELKKAGYEVDVFEKNSATGGRMATRHGGNIPFDTGADFFSENYSSLKSYAQELNIPWLTELEGSTHRIIKNGKTYNLDLEHAYDAITFSVIPFFERIKFIIFCIYIKIFYPDLDFFNLSNVSASLDIGPADKYIKRFLGKATNDYIADSFTGIMQFHRADDISTAAFFALVSTFLSKNTIRMRHTSRGIGEIPKVLAERIGVQTNAVVENIVGEKGSISMIINGINRSFDAVVVATPASSTRSLIKNPSQEQTLILDNAKYASTMVVSFKIPSDLFTKKVHCTYVPYTENKVISGYSNEGCKGKSHCDGNITLLNIFLHEGAAREFMSLSDEEIFNKLSEELTKVCPEIKDKKLIPYDIARWPEAMPKFSHKYISIVRENIDLAEGAGGVFLAGDYLNSPWTEGACRSGQRAAKLVQKYLS